MQADVAAITAAVCAGILPEEQEEEQEQEQEQDQAPSKHKGSGKTEHEVGKEKAPPPAPARPRERKPGPHWQVDALLALIFSFAKPPADVCPHWDRVLVQMARERTRHFLRDKTALSPELVRRVEGAVFERCGQAATDAYTQRIRKLGANLKRNTDLCTAVLEGRVEAEQLAGMTDAELASPELTAARVQAKEAHLREAQRSRSRHAHPLTSYPCPMCGHSRCYYRIVRRKMQVDRFVTFMKCEKCDHSFDI